MDQLEEASITGRSIQHFFVQNCDKNEWFKKELALFSKSNVVNINILQTLRLQLPKSDLTELYDKYMSSNDLTLVSDFLDAIFTQVDQGIEEEEIIVNSDSDSDSQSDYECDCNAPCESNSSNDSVQIDDVIVEIFRQSMTQEDLLYNQSVLIKRVSFILEIDPDVAACLLHQFLWNPELLIHEYSENPPKMLKSLSLTKSSPLTLTSTGTGECEVCFEETELFSLPCGHSFCFSCWYNLVIENLNVGNLKITCMFSGCKCPLSFSEIKRIADANINNENENKNSTNIDNYFAESMLIANKQLIHCPNPECQKVLSRKSVGLCGVAKCECGSRICWKCKELAHAPLPCSHTGKIREFTDESNSSFIWASYNTQPCPKCKTRIEKNGGCNHMICQSCNYEFCWICSHEWYSHPGNGYSCTKKVDFELLFGSKSQHDSNYDFGISQKLSEARDDGKHDKQHFENLQKELSSNHIPEALGLELISTIKEAVSVHYHGIYFQRQFKFTSITGRVLSGVLGNLKDLLAKFRFEILDYNPKNLQNYIFDLKSDVLKILREGEYRYSFGYDF